MVSLSLNFRVRQGLNNGARISAREGHEALLTCSSKEAPSRILFRGRSVMSFFEPQTELPPMFRSGRLQEEQRLVAKTCSFFRRIFLPQCPNFAELELSKEAKSYHENSCVRITGKKINTAAPHPFVESI